MSAKRKKRAGLPVAPPPRPAPIIVLDGKRYAVLVIPEQDYMALRDGAAEALGHVGETLAATLLTQRLSAGLSVAELAKRARVPPSVVRQVEAGELPPGPHYVEAVGAVCVAVFRERGAKPGRRAPRGRGAPRARRAGRAARRG